MSFIPLDSQPTFSCNSCGECCSHIRGFIPPKEREFIEQFAFGKLPIIQLAPIDRMTFPLWDFEAKRFLRWGEEEGIDPRIKPLRAILDLKSGTTIVLSYFMDSEGDACPFLKEKKCAIYHTKRAYVCRLFPFNKSPLAFSETIDSLAMFGECGGMGRILPALPKNKDDAIRFLKDAFPNGEFENALQSDLISEWSNKVVVDLMKKGVIRPAMNYPYDLLLKRVENSRKIDFTDFLVECGYQSAEEKEKMIERFDSNLDAKEWIENH